MVQPGFLLAEHHLSIRPIVLCIPCQVDWHKGTALTHLVEALGLSQQPDVVAIYVGDDHTDEDAFRTLEETQKGGSWVLWATPQTAALWAAAICACTLDRHKDWKSSGAVPDPCAAAC